MPLQPPLSSYHSSSAAVTRFVLGLFWLSFHPHHFFCNAWHAEWIQRQPAQRIAPPRSGHVAFTIQKTPFVFGGYLEETITAEQQQQQQQAPRSTTPETTTTTTTTARASTTTTSTTATTTMKRYVNNDLWKWNGDAWEQQKSSSLPPPRLASAAAVLNNTAYLFGGWDPQTPGTGGIILDDVHELHFAEQDSDDTTSTESTLQCHANICRMPGGPTSRHVAVALPQPQQILLHTHRCQDYIYLYHPRTHTFQKQPTTGPCPSPRGLHAATLLADGSTVVVFGGAAQDGSMSDETFVLDTNTWTWSQLHCHREQQQQFHPTARASPCLVTLNEDCVLLFGGAQRGEGGMLVPRGDVWLLNVREKQWERLLTDHYDDDEDDDANKDVDERLSKMVRPPPRNAATLSELLLEDDATILPKDPKDSSLSSSQGTGTTTTTTAKSFLLTGGWHPFRQTWDDCYILRVSSLTPPTGQKNE